MSNVLALLGLTLVAVAGTAHGLSEDLGHGYRHHGVATPVSNHRGTVATVDGDGRNVVLVWLFDHRGGYALLMIDAETGASEQFPMPFEPGGDCPYSSILSSRNKYYTHFNNHFVEFDPVKRAFTFHRETAPQMAMGMTEDDEGVIWSVTYPSSGVVSYNPATGEFKDFGHVHKENWNQYQRYVAADDQGWLYFGIGSTASQVVALNPRTAEAKPLLAEHERVKGSGYVYRGVDGKVYGHAGKGEADWFVLHGGSLTKLGAKPEVARKPIITDSQSLFHGAFPDGSTLKSCDLVNRLMVVQRADGGPVRELTFDYTSEGAHIMGIAVAPDGTVCGGTAFPMRFFSYDPRTDAWVNRESYGQWNTVARQGERYFVGGYGAGFLLEWDPAKPWVTTEKGKLDCNPLFLTQCEPTIHRPHDLLAYPDGKTLVLAGTPGYGYTGGGLLIWERESGASRLIEHTALLPELSTQSLAPLPDRRIVGGATTAPGTGGEKKALQAELYVLDLESGKIEWHEALFPGAQEYTDLCTTSNGLVYGVVDRTRFFVFSPMERRVVHECDLKEAYGPTISHQGPRVFVSGADGAVYVLFVKGVAQVDASTHAITMLAESPVPIGPGGDYLDGRIYFGSGSHLYSFAVPMSDR